jgi:hypothetical protein
MAVDDGFYATPGSLQPGERTLQFLAGQPKPAADCNSSPDGRASGSEANPFTEPIDQGVEPSAVTEDATFQSRSKP